MESKKAEEYIKENGFEDLEYAEADISCGDAITAVEIAEEEAAKKHKKEMADYKEKVVDAHRLGCPNLIFENQCGTGGCKGNKISPNCTVPTLCDDNCIYMQKFKELINKKL